MDEYDGKQYVGMGLHRRRSVIVRMTPEGKRIGSAVRIDSEPFELMRQVASWGEAPEVVLEATCGWYWAADVLAEAGATVHLAHPLGVKGFAYRRVKNDERDASDLADLLRMGRLPEAWIAPRAVRALREQVRHRCKLVALRSGLKAQVHAVLARQGVTPTMTDLFGVGGRKLLDELRLDPPFQARVLSLLRLIDAFTFEIDTVGKRMTTELNHHPGYTAIQAIPGVRPVLAAVFVAEIGDVTRPGSRPYAARDRPLLTVKNRPTPQPNPVVFPALTIARRTGSASRPSRYAVDLPVEPGPRPLTGACPHPRGNRKKRSQPFQPPHLTGPAPSGMSSYEGRSLTRDRSPREDTANRAN